MKNEHTQYMYEIVIELLLLFIRSHGFLSPIGLKRFIKLSVEYTHLTNSLLNYLIFNMHILILGYD